jgi:hypothetical protein
MFFIKTDYILSKQMNMIALDDHILKRILIYINDGSTYKAACLVCRQWYAVARRLFKDGDVFANHLITLLQLFPGANWDMQRLSANPNISWEYVQLHQDIHWSIKYLSLNPNVTWNTVQSHPSSKWSYLMLASNPNITMDIVQSNIDLFAYWGYTPCLENPSITWEIFKLKNIQHDNACLEINPNITWDIIQHAERTEPEWDWNYAYLSANVNITWDIVCSHPGKCWDYGNMSSNPNITWDIVKSHPDLNWDYNVLSTNPNITWDMINSDLRLSKQFFSLNPNVTWRLVRDNPDFSWDFELLSANVFNSKKYVNAMHTNDIVLGVQLRGSLEEDMRRLEEQNPGMVVLD